MTKILLTIALWTVFTFNANSQIYEPTILILSPNKTTADKKLKKEIEEFNSLIKENQKQTEQELKQALKEMEDRPENIKMMYQKQIEFSKEMDFYSMIPSVAEGYLQYRFFERFENLLIYAIEEKSNGNIEQLNTIADKHNMQYIVNFPQVHSFIENNSKKTTIRVQLFDNNQQKFLLDKEFTGHDRNPGFEFTCSDSSLSCTINNSLSQALGEIITIVAINNPTIIRERELAKERAEVLFSEYYPKEPSKEIPDIIHKNDTSISTVGFYHGFMDDSKTKFIGFFALSSKATNFQELRDENDKSLQIISDDIYDLDDVPKIYANVVVGINYNSKWYLKKDKVTYFNSDDFKVGKKEFFNNLQKWGFFKENLSDFSPDFWETYFFEKVKDVTKEPDYEKYYESIYKSQERRNKGYIGMYEIVADQMRKEQAELAEQFKETIGEQILRPFLEQQKTDKPNEFTDYSLMYKKFTLIFPKDRLVVLNPVQIEDNKEQRQIRYFVVFPDTKEIYEWTYLKPKILEGKNWHYGSEIIEQLSTVTDWNFGFETLDDQDFWNNYILKKDGDKYKYLIKIK
ncbi:MAG: hypothetical protein JJ892_00250 [Balneola sp.]|nr:hypothetical protein [Balneola sp.]MBO6651898.1 hypothetical protein [Balneola sp.]MBO6709991.1 hypothetical protein [Balneola sp.]MBO6798675.1 hypothetical protein [Balneola sp.]MBO6871854.1 hypothetical protein [Balneola sp.]